MNRLIGLRLLAALLLCMTVVMSASTPRRAQASAYYECAEKCGETCISRANRCDIRCFWGFEECDCNKKFVGCVNFCQGFICFYLVY